MSLIRNVVCTAAVVLAGMGVSHADCFVLHTNGPATLDVNPAIAVGSVLSSVTLSWPQTRNGGSLGCSFPSGNQLYTFYGIGIPNGNLYPTGIPGVAYRGRLPGWAFAGLDGYWPTQNRWASAGSRSDMAAGSAVIEFVKTGPIGSGTFGPQTVMDGFIAGMPFVKIILDNAIIIKPTIPACTVTQSAITVNLEDTTTDQLATMGNTSKDKGFNIPLNCTSSANISLAFSGNVADNTNAVFSNLSGSTNANSVGVQILKDNTPVPTVAGSYLNLGVVNGSTSVPLTARYYARTNNADVGAVSAIAYATILYN